MRKGAGQGPPGFGCGEDTLAMNKAVGPLALVPASNHLPTPTHTSAADVGGGPPPTARIPHPRPSPPRTPVHHSCPAAGCQRVTPPPAGHVRRPETRQAPRVRAARICLRWPRCSYRGHGTCRSPMRPRTCHPVQSTPPQPQQPRPSHPPHPVSPGPAHAATLPAAEASPSVAPRTTCASFMSYCRLPSRHAPARWACAPPRDTPGTQRPRAARTCLRRTRFWCRSHVACRCPMRPRTCHPVQSTPPQPQQPRPSHPPHPISPGPAHAATLPAAEASPSVAPPHTCASAMSCRCHRATPQPAGHARRLETRQAPLARAARTWLR